jgi:hypothetical protein
MIIPAINQPFKVSFLRYPEKFNAVIISIDNRPEHSDRKYKIQITKKFSVDAIGHPYSFTDSIVEVETNWFNTELCGRKIQLC